MQEASGRSVYEQVQEFFLDPLGFHDTIPTDLARWCKALFTGRAMEGDYLKAMLKSVPARTGPDHEYGLGVQIIPLRAGLLVGHTGFFPGYLTAMGYLREHDLALALQVNTSESAHRGRRPTSFLEDLVDLIAEDLNRQPDDSDS